MRNREIPSDPIGRPLTLPGAAYRMHDTLSSSPPRAAEPRVSGWITPQLIERTRIVWQKRSARPLTRDEAIDILLNVGRLIDVLCDGRKQPEKEGVGKSAARDRAEGCKNG